MFESAYPESKLNLFCSGLWPIFAAKALALEEGESAVHIGKRTGFSAASSSCSPSSALTLKTAEEAFFGEEVELLSQNNFFIKSSS